MTEACAQKTAVEVPGYEVLAPLGRGASGTVWRVRREGSSDGPELAAKVLAVDTEIAAVRTEVAIATSLKHDHVIQVVDVVGGTGEGGEAAVVVLSEVCEGGSLHGLVSARTHLLAGETVTVVAPLARALADLHRQGIVHGDVSSGNVLLSAEGRPMLADLGLASLKSSTVGGAGGTEGFIAPEVLAGSAPTSASDVYALGCLAWMCLAGDPPPPVVYGVELTDVAPHAPERLVRAIEQCLVAEPEERPSPERLARAILAAADPEPLRLTCDLAADGAEPSPSSTPSGEPLLTRRLWREAQAQMPWDEDDDAWRFPWVKTIKVLAILAVLVAVGFWGVPKATAWFLSTDQGRRVVEATGAAELDLSRFEWLPQEAAADGREAATAAARAGNPGVGRASAPATSSTTAEQAAPKLVSARAQAWAEADVRGVRFVHVPGSAVLKDDVAAVQHLKDSNLTMEGLTTKTTVLDSSTQANNATVDVEIRRAQYTVLRDGTPQEKVKAHTERVRLELTQHKDQWRIADWSPLPERVGQR